LIVFGFRYFLYFGHLYIAVGGFGDCRYTRNGRKNTFTTCIFHPDA
jgi:hypothetical protein